MPKSAANTQVSRRFRSPHSRPARGLVATLIGAAASLACGGLLFGKPLPIPNGSFEGPTTTYVTTFVNNWQKAPKPPDYDEGGGFLWDQLVGTFKNTSPGASDHLENCDGIQAAWFFCVPGVAIFQDFESTDYSHANPIHAFGSSYEPGKAYIATVGLNGGGGGMQEGASLLLRFYYRTAGGARIYIASTAIVHSFATFPDHTHFVNFQVRTPFVKADDPWAGKHIGLELYSNVTEELQGGYWDVDNFRLEEIPDPPSITTLGTDARIAWPSRAGYSYQLQTSPNLQTWAPFGSALPGTGSEQSQLYPLANAPTFFRVFVSATAPSPPPAASAKKKSRAK